jgi:hypothetical protein
LRESPLGLPRGIFDDADIRPAPAPQAAALTFSVETAATGLRIWEALW